MRKTPEAAIGTMSQAKRRFEKKGAAAVICPFAVFDWEGENMGFQSLIDMEFY